MKHLSTKSFLFFCILVCCLSAVGQVAKVRPANWATKVEGLHLKNLYKLNDEVYRSEQPDSAAFVQVYKYGMKSILNLRSHHSDKGLSKNLPFKLYDVEMEAKSFSDAEIVAALKVLKESPKPVLVHCRQGSDRTGVVLAMYRIVFQNWSKEQALDELKNGGFKFHTQYTNIPEYIAKVDVEKIKREMLK